MADLYYRYQGNKFLKSSTLELLHDQMIEDSGGLKGIKDIKGVESAALKPKTTINKTDAYPTFFTKVAAVGFEIARGHSFSDGNKRTSIAAMLWTLRANGFKPKPSDDAVTTLALLIAVGHLQVEGIRMALIHWCDLDVADEFL